MLSVGSASETPHIFSQTPQERLTKSRKRLTIARERLAIARAPAARGRGEGAQSWVGCQGAEGMVTGVWGGRQEGGRGAVPHRPLEGGHSPLRSEPRSGPRQHRWPLKGARDGAAPFAARRACRLACHPERSRRAPLAPTTWPTSTWRWWREPLRASPRTPGAPPSGCTPRMAGRGARRYHRRGEGRERLANETVKKPTQLPVGVRVDRVTAGQI